MAKSLQCGSQKFTMGQCNNSFINLPIRAFDQMETKSLALINFDNFIILKYFVLYFVIMKWVWSLESCGEIPTYFIVGTNLIFEY